MRSSRRLGRRNQNRRRRRGSKGAPSPSEEEEAAVATPQGHARGGVTGYLVKKKRGSDLRSFLADVVPLDRLLLEADCPYIMGLGVDDSRCASSTCGKLATGEMARGGRRDLSSSRQQQHVPGVRSKPCCCLLTAGTLQGSEGNSPVDMTTQPYHLVAGVCGRCSRSRRGLALLNAAA